MQWKMHSAVLKIAEGALLELLLVNAWFSLRLASPCTAML